jgi:calcium/calmodulin-dependent protein kinase I
MVKIADFGFAKRIVDPNKPNCLSTQCGTPNYVAPEILEGTPYGCTCDMWSLGVIVYCLLGGYPPFVENNQRNLFRRIRKGQYEFDPRYWGEVSQDAKDMIAGLLCVNRDDRLTADGILANKWVNLGADELAGKDLGANLEELKKYNAKRKMKAAIKTVMAANKFVSLGVDFQTNLD